MAKTSKLPIVHHTARCFLAGQCVLMAYDADGKEIMGIVCHPKGYAYQWASSGSRAADKRRMEKEVANTFGDQS
jgi:hypothetical protein